MLSNRPRLLYDYFKQLFAQVTNPPLDGIREELVTQISTTIGPEGNLLEPTPEAARQIKLKTPVLDNEELARIRHVDLPGFRAATIPMLFPVAEGAGRPRAAPSRSSAARASQAVARGLHVPDPVRPRRRRGARADPRARSPRRACTTT